MQVHKERLYRTTSTELTTEWVCCPSSLRNEKVPIRFIFELCVIRAKHPTHRVDTSWVLPKFGHYLRSMRDNDWNLSGP